MRSLMALVVFAAITLVAVPGHAALSVTIKEGTTTIKTASRSSSAGQNSTLFLLSCGTPPCSQTFGSFVFEDISATSRARIIKTDGASVDKIELKGVRIRSVSSGTGTKKLTIQYKTDDGDLTPLPGNLYPYTATLFGSFVRASGAGAATECTNAQREFCARLEVRAQGNTVNAAGSETLASVSVPPISTLSGAIPAGLSDAESINCGTQSVADSCRPQLTATIIAFFTGSGEVLTLPGSAITGNANRSTQDEGLVDTCFEIAEQGCQDAFVVHTALAQSMVAVPKSPRAGSAPVKAGRNVSVKFELKRPTRTVNAQNVTLIALDPGSAEQSSTDRAASSRSYVSFVPAVLGPSGLRSLILDYDIIVDGEFSDCVDGSLRVEVTFVGKEGQIEGPVVIPLGAGPGFRHNCSLAGLSGTDLLENREDRADATALGAPCCEKPCCVFRRLGGSDKRVIRSVSFILEGRSGIDQKVVVRRVQVNDFVFTPVEATDFVRSCEVPANGRTVRVTKRTGAGAGQEFIVPDGDLRGSSCSLQARVNTSKLAPDPNAVTRYRAELCVSGRCLLDFVEFDVKSD